MTPVQPPLLTDLLKEVSRSFYLTLRVLPKPVRPQIGLAYLLARTSDTIADTAVLPPSDRIVAMAALGQRILGTTQQPLAFPQLLSHQQNASERAILARVEESLSILSHTPELDRQLIQRVMAVIVSGQTLDLQRFATASADKIVPLQTLADLDDYTYRVAGCVGEFWTAMCLAHLFKCGENKQRFLHESGIRFGKGLQLVNILRDLPADLRQGRCYVPLDELTRAGLKPEDLLNPANEPTFRPVYNRLLTMATEHLEAGWAYTNALPRLCVRVRLACAWPVLIGFETLRLLGAKPVLNPDVRVKVSRSAVRSIILRTLVTYPFSGRWEKLASIQFSKDAET